MRWHRQIDDWTPLEQRLAEHVRGAVPTDSCPSVRRVIELAAHGRRHGDWARHMRHVVCCPACLQTFREAREALRGPERHQWWGARAALGRTGWPRRTALVVAAALLFCFLVPGRWSGDPQQRPSILARLRAGSRVAGELVLCADRVLFQEHLLPHDLAQMVLSFYRAPHPLPRIQLRETHPKQLALLSPPPGNATICDARPLFRWKGGEGARQYRFRLEVAAGPQDQPWQRAERLLDLVSSQGWYSLPAGLELSRGCTYRWFVEAGGRSEALRSPVAMFRVLNAAEAELLERVRKFKLPALIAAVYDRLGMYQDAVDMLAEVRSANPESPVARVAFWNAEQRLYRHLNLGFAALP
ncbi:MAG: hypothetical protein HY320_02050 [Armatimonadetes bacterium]|nr:hypothetical protein [Armatimonadota bacterium]